MAGGLRILLVDDEARILRALKALFRDYQTFETTNPLEAAALAKQHDVDVVICDQRMPEKTGVDVLRDIKETHPRALRILLTGYSDLKAVIGSVNEGEVFRFVHKPWDNTELRELVATPPRSRAKRPSSRAMYCPRTNTIAPARTWACSSSNTTRRCSSASAKSCSRITR